MHRTKLPRLSLPRRIHISLRLVVLSFLPQLSRRAGDDARAWDRTLARGDPPVDAQVRRRVCTPPARRIGRYGDTWHLDEVFCKVNGELVYLWRAGDQERETLDVLVQKRRNLKASETFLPKATEGFTLQSARTCHRQALELRNGAPSDDARS